MSAKLCAITGMCLMALLVIGMIGFFLFMLFTETPVVSQFEL